MYRLAVLAPCPPEDETECRWSWLPTSVNGSTFVLNKACLSRAEVKELEDSAAFDETVCGAGLSVLREEVAYDQTILLPLACNETTYCPEPSDCKTSLANPEVSYCCGPEDREKRSAKKIHPKKEPEPEPTTVPLTTMTATAENGPGNCRRVFATHDAKKVFDKEITSVEILELFHHKEPCRKGSYSFKGNHFIVQGCRALFKICFVETATETAPFTTKPSLTCQKEISLYGLDLEVDGIIESVEFKPLPHNPYGYHAYFGDYGSNDNNCFEDVHYSYKGSKFIATSSCKGVFEICYGPKPVTTAPFTTTEEAPTCQKYVSTGNLDEEVPGTIISVQILRQIITGYHFYSKICEKGVNYGYKDSRFYVKDCEAIFNVCWKKNPITTAPFETTPDPLRCRKVVNSYGVQKEFDGEIESVTYIVLPDKKKQQPSKYTCREGIDYHYYENKFVASSSCPGLFKVCYRVVVLQRLTTPKQTEMCKQVYSRKNLVEKFDGRITSIELVRQIVVGYGYSYGYGYAGDHHGIAVCEKDQNYYVTDEDTFRVKNCWALFKVCYEEFEPTTTPAKLETTSPAVTTKAPEECQRVYNAYGLELDFGKPIKSVVFIEVRQQDGHNPTGYQEAGFGAYLEANFGPGRRLKNGKPVSNYGHGGYGYGQNQPVSCIRDKDYKVMGSVLTATPYCQGFFQVCVDATPERFTTEAPPEPECQSVNVFGEVTRVFEGQRIVSVDVIRQYGYYHGRGYCAKGGIKYEDDTLEVLKCRGELRVCLVPAKQTTRALTTEKMVTTTAPEQITCTRLYNNYGIKQYFSGNVTSVIYLQVKAEEESRSHYGYFDNTHIDLCHEGRGYFFQGRSFVATPYCPGFYQVCYKGTGESGSYK